MTKSKKYFLTLIIGIFFGILTTNNNYAYAAKDTKKPKITITYSTEEPTKDKIKLEVKATDSSGVQTLKWATGKREAAYFKKSGKILTLSSKGTSSVTIKKNGTYSFYAIDKAGNVRVKTTTVANIDLAYPSINMTLSTEAFTNKNLSILLAIEEYGFGIANVKYLKGEKVEDDFTGAGKTIKLTELKAEVLDAGNTHYEYSGKIKAKSNDTYTFLVEDTAGNRTLERVIVNNIDKNLPTVTITPNTTEPTNQAVTVNIVATDDISGVKEVSYLSGIKEIKDFIIDEASPSLVKLNKKGKGTFATDTNGDYTILVKDNAGNQALNIINIANIDNTNPTIELDYFVMNQEATISVEANDDESGINSMKYLKGNYTNVNHDKWSTKAKNVSSSNAFKVNSSGNYSVLVEDLAGNLSVDMIYIELEFKAVWISYLEFQAYAKNGFTEQGFQDYIDNMFNNVVNMGMNAVVVHVRPFGDAMYDSSYFPWSKYISGKQGLDPGFDPMEYMVEAAHDRGLEFHAWLNPYRVTSANTDYKSLAVNNPAREWYEDNDKTNDRNVLSFGGNLYYNPAVKEVQNLIVGGIKEIVYNYDVDGIHFDDYFYPTLGSNYAKTFDNIEYDTYVKSIGDKKPLSIADWRRNNVNTLVKKVYKAVKRADSSVQFGISPGGFIDYLSSDAAYYVDYKTWLSSDNYIDYICPQIYWSFSNTTYPYDKTLQKWLSYRTSDTIKMYIGIATYKAGSSLEYDWKYDPDVLRKQVLYGRDTGLVDGFIFFRYDFFYNSVTKPGVDRLLEILE